MNDNNLDYNNFPAKKFLYFFLSLFVINLITSILLTFSNFSVLKGLVLTIFIFAISILCFFEKKNKENTDNANILITALLIHAAKIDDNYTNVEKEIIKKALISLNTITLQEADELLKKAEKMEHESNQIVAFTKEIKKNTMEFRIKIIEILWEIVYSDSTSDSFESNLIRRVCGLLYVSDKDSGMIKLKVKNLVK